MRSPGFLLALQEQLERLDYSVLEHVNRSGGLDVRDLIDYLLKPVDYSVIDPCCPDSSAYKDNTDSQIDAFWAGKDSLTSGQTAFVLIATPESFIVPSGFICSILETNLMKTSWVKKTYVLVDPRDRPEVEKMISRLGRDNIFLMDGYLTFLLTPDNRLHAGDEDYYLASCGSGDVIGSIVESNLIEPGVEHIFVSDANNLLGCSKPALVGQHIEGKKQVTCEITSRSDKNKTFFCEHAGFNQLIESHRFLNQSDDFIHTGTETFVFNSSVLKDSIRWKWHRRKVNVEGKLVVRFERTLCDLTANYQAQFIFNPRHFCYSPLSFK